MRRQIFGIVSFCIMATLIGCGDKSTVEPVDTGTESGALPDLTSGTEAAATEHGDSEDDPHKGHNHAKDAKPKEMPGRKTFDGNWLLAFPQLVPPQQEGQEFRAGERTVFLFRISESESDSPSISVVAGRQDLQQVEFSELKIADDEISFTVSRPNEGKAFDYSGKLVTGLVVGSTLFADGNLMMSRLLPTNEKTFARIPEMIPLPETQMYSQLATSPVPDEDTRAFVEMIPVSPLGRFAYRQLVGMTAGNNAPNEELENVISDFVESMEPWGDRAAAFVEFEAFTIASMSGYDVEWCLEKIDELEEKFADYDDLKRVSAQISPLRAQIKYRQTTELLASKEEADRAKGKKQAEEILESTQFEPFLTSLLADDARLNDRPDEAIRRYAELVALPMQERMLQQASSNDAVQKILPTERLAALWKKKHGSSEGLDEYLAEVYEESLLSFIDPPIKASPEDAGQHIILCELFTGSRCVPCVSADVALEGIEKTYPRSQVVTLRYHVHVPGHDPMTNDDGEARFYNFYKAAGTPSMYVDGAQLEGAAGVMPNAPQTYQRLRYAIDEFLRRTRGGKDEEATSEKDDEETSDDKASEDATSDDKDADSEKGDEKESAEKVETKEEAVAVTPKVMIDLQVSKQQDTIEVSASVSGLTDETGNVRLMVALAESGIRYEAFNGIRHHDMVVRQLLGGDRGTSPKDGVLGYQGTVNVEELRDRLHGYLTEFEENQGVEFNSMPLELANLSVVAFVQNVETRRIFQTVVVPVTDSAAGQ